MSDHITKYGFGFWAASLIETGEFIGFIGIKNVPFTAPFTPAVEIGWRLAFKHWGKGYASEGATACLKYGFETLGLKEIVSLTTVKNIRSRHVMEKIGMHYDPKDDFDHPLLLEEGHPLRRHVLYRLTKNEWSLQQPESGLSVRICKTSEENILAIAFRQKHFFDARGIQDPYTWTFGLENHRHVILQKEDRIIGYAHIQYWPARRAALRIIVIDEMQQHKGYGSYLMRWCEQMLKEDGIQTIHTEAHPEAIRFYERLGYSNMPFDEPDGHPSDEQDISIGKYL